ncbi:IS4 family transposase, partial [Enterococcus sp. CWB-B31]|uniref:IS4 family transposase n=1 Tax=Enterococcus sp. CWB-B31 TaxID=2885159 RepID=UPI001E3417F0
MKTSKERQFQHFCETLHQLFDTKKLQSLACAFFSQSIATESLVELSAHLARHLHLSITPQALHERFNETAVHFLESFFHQLIQEKMPTSGCSFMNEQTFFRRIRIADATTFCVDSKLHDSFPGSGGVCHTAGVKIQLEYDLTTGQMIEVFLGAEKDSDHLLYLRNTAHILPGDLVIRDLGYFKLKEYQAIQADGGYYVTRTKINTLFT